jgi:hypothetical protein
MIVAPFSFVGSTSDLDRGLIIHLDANNPSSYPGTGTTVSDLASSYDHTLTNAPYTELDGIKCFDASGSPTTYIQVNGTGPTLPTSGYTYITWARIKSSSASWRTLFRTEPNDHPILVEIGNENLGFYDNDTSAFIDSGYDVTSIIDTWAQFAVVGDSSSSIFYINGVQVGSTEYGAGGNNHFRWGGHPGQSFGYVANMYLWDRKLTLQEILLEYNQSYSTFSNKGSLDNPGISAQDIYDSGQTTSGWYYIQTSTMAQPKQVYCNMTDESGGWMLIGYTPSFNNSNGGLGAGLGYPNTWENGEGTLNRLRTNAMDLWFHNGSPQCTQVLKMATTVYNQDPFLANAQIANKVVYTNPSNLLLSSVSNYPSFVNDTPMTGTWYPVKGHTLMSTSLTVNAPGDWIYYGGSWWTVCGPSTQLLSNGRSGNAQGTGSWTNPSSSNLYGMSNVAATTNSNRTDIQTYAVYIK